MKKSLLFVMMATVFAMVSWSCSEETLSDDTMGAVNVCEVYVKYVHQDLTELPQPVQDAIRKMEPLVYVVKGTFNGQEAYMFNWVYSSRSIGHTMYADGTEFYPGELRAAWEEGLLNDWVCIYHHSRDLDLYPLPADSEE